MEAGEAPAKEEPAKEPATEATPKEAADAAEPKGDADDAAEPAKRVVKVKRVVKSDAPSNEE